MLIIDDIIVTYIKENVIAKLQKLWSLPRNLWAGNKSPMLLKKKKTVCTGDLSLVYKIFTGRPGSVIFPVTIPNEKCKINAEIAKENIPLLLSKSSLKKAMTVIGLDYDEATILGKEINLQQCTSGHYCIDISPSSNCSNIEEILYLEKD